MKYIPFKIKSRYPYTFCSPPKEIASLLLSHICFDMTIWLNPSRHVYINVSVWLQWHGVLDICYGMLIFENNLNFFILLIHYV